MIDYTLVIGVDAKTLSQLLLVWPTWVKYKPSLTKVPLIVFFDREQLSGEWSRIPMALGKCCDLVPWPPPGVHYQQTDESRFGHPQRAKMLSGFVHVAAKHVKTKYWLKLDTDVVATGDDQWVDPLWFDGNPAIIAPPWGFSKPARSMSDMDQWVVDNAKELGPLAKMPPLGLVALPGASRLSHRRVCSWCAFFQTEFTKQLAYYFETTCGVGQMPIPSQDGACWYAAHRLGLPIIRVPIKNRGFELVSHGRLEKRAKELLQCQTT